MAVHYQNTTTTHKTTSIALYHQNTTATQIKQHHEYHIASSSDIVFAVLLLQVKLLRIQTIMQMVFSYNQHEAFRQHCVNIHVGKRKYMLCWSGIVWTPNTQSWIHNMLREMEQKWERNRNRAGRRGKNVKKSGVTEMADGTADECLLDIKMYIINVLITLPQTLRASVRLRFFQIHWAICVM